MTYVGGGFHRRGLHSVLEPAAAGVPILFGPAHGSARAAGELALEGGARVVGGAPELAEALLEWMENESLRAEAGSRAAGYIERHRGAAARTGSLLESLLPRGART